MVTTLLSIRTFSTFKSSLKTNYFSRAFECQIVKRMYVFPNTHQIRNKKFYCIIVLYCINGNVLFYITGQDLNTLCIGGDVIRAMQCASQVMHIYDKSHKHAKDTMLCWNECKRCPNCLRSLDLNIPQLQSTLWEQV